MLCGNELLFLAGIKHADRNFSAMEFIFFSFGVGRHQVHKCASGNYVFEAVSEVVEISKYKHSTYHKKPRPPQHCVAHAEQHRTTNSQLYHFYVRLHRHKSYIRIACRLCCQCENWAEENFIFSNSLFLPFSISLTARFSSLCVYRLTLFL